MPTGYEPVELLLLYPAICWVIIRQKGFLASRLKFCLFYYIFNPVRLVGVAQLVEHRTHKPGVVGSIPTSDTSQKMVR